MANFAAVMRKIFCLIAAFAAIFAAGCSRDGAEGVRSGDLLFVYIPGDYDIYGGGADDRAADAADAAGADGVDADGVVSIDAENSVASTGKEAASNGAASADAAASEACPEGIATRADAASEPEPLNIHVAILQVEGDSTWIVDATIKRGVARYPLQDFLKDFTLADGSLPQLTVMRPKVSAAQARQFVANALQYAGMPYDVDFLMDNDAMYCSELVYDAYVTGEGERLFSLGTIDFLSADGTVPLYWRQIFELLQRDIPQGHPGIMPGDMTSSPRLESVEFSVESLE